MDDWVGELRLRVRTDSPETAELRQGSEQLARTAIERGAALLEARHPGRVVLVRRLSLRWQLEEETLADATQLEALAGHVAKEIERMAIPDGLLPSDTAAAVLFEDEAQWRASHLLARSEGTIAWFHGALEDPSMGDALAVLADPARRAMAEATLAHLARANRLAPVLASQSPAVVAVLAAALGCTSSTPLPAPSGQEVAAEIRGEFTGLVMGWPPLPPAARELALRVHAALLLESSLGAADVVSLAASLSRQEPLGPQHPAVPALATLEGAPSRPEASDHAFSEDAELLVATHCAGMFFLCDRLQELSLPESLWKACLPVGQVLAAAAAALLGAPGEGDPAAAILGGVEGIGPCPEVTLDQLKEVVVATASAVAAALPRRGLASLPAVVVSLTNHPSGRLLTASAEGSPFALFAWPAESPETIAVGLDLLLASWPPGAPLVAEPALVSFDRSCRLRTLEVPPSMALLVPCAPTTTGTALLAVVAGAPSLLFAARADAPQPDSATGFVSCYLQRHGRIRMDAERIEIVFSAEQNDLAVRRAGLDRDPGWLPWLGRSVGFVFEEFASVADEPLPPKENHRG